MGQFLACFRPPCQPQDSNQNPCHADFLAENSSFKPPVVILLSGYNGHGKNLFAGHLERALRDRNQKVQQLSFAQRLKLDIVTLLEKRTRGIRDNELCPSTEATWTDWLNWLEENKETLRPLLIAYGEAVKNTELFGKHAAELWAREVLREITLNRHNHCMSRHAIDSEPDFYIITDHRFDIEEEVLGEFCELIKLRISLVDGEPKGSLPVNRDNVTDLGFKKGSETMKIVAGTLADSYVSAKRQ